MIVNTATKEVWDETRFRRAHKHTSFPRELSEEVLEPFGFAPLEIDEKPEDAAFVRVTSAPPKKVGKKWKQSWVSEQILVSAQYVKSEAARRITEIVPEWKQRNLLAQAVTLLNKGKDNWTDTDAAAWQAGEALWAQVSAIRAASDAIEAMDPIPRDFHDDKYWP